MALPLLLAALLVPPAAQHTGVRPTNAEMTAIYTDDQAARATSKIDWSVVGPEDAKRRTRTRALLDAGKLESGDDYYHAAFVFQHGGRPDDYLMAHALSLVAAARGKAEATWIAAASLDRYLQAIGQPQIYGTQFIKVPDQPWSQGSYDRVLVSDALRQASGVLTVAEQEQRLKDLASKIP